MAEKTVAPDMPEQSTPARETTREDERYLAPPVDIYATDDGLVVLADLPGVSTDRLNISVKDDILTIEGRTESTMPGTPVYREFDLPSFFRQFQLADSVDVSNITAAMKHGVLALTLPKAEAAKPKTIKVAVG
jgi:HSP20 family protein